MMPAYLVAELGRIVVAGVAGRIGLLQFNVAGRGRTVRKIFLSEAASLLGVRTLVHLHY